MNNIIVNKKYKTISQTQLPIKKEVKQMFYLIWIYFFLLSLLIIIFFNSLLFILIFIIKFIIIILHIYLLIKN